MPAAIEGHTRHADEKRLPVLVARTAAAADVANHLRCKRKVAEFRATRAPGFVALRGALGAALGALTPVKLGAVVVAAVRETRAMLRACG